MNQCEIAKKLGISQSAVSLVLRDPTTSRVSAEKKELIIHYLKSNSNANASGCKRTWNIGYLTDPTQNIHSEFFQSSLSGTEEEAARCHYNLVLECVRNTTVNLLRKNKVDGIIVRSGKVLEVLKESSSSLPAVLLNCSTDTLQYDVVMPDNRGGCSKSPRIWRRKSATMRYFYVLKTPTLHTAATIRNGAAPLMMPAEFTV